MCTVSTEEETQGENKKNTSLTMWENKEKPHPPKTPNKIPQNTLMVSVSCNRTHLK